MTQLTRKENHNFGHFDVYLRSDDKKRQISKFEPLSTALNKDVAKTKTNDLETAVLLTCFGHSLFCVVSMWAVLIT
uniref:Uncharacterized protein n=1 Tax=Oryzias latipes TaxID=8090 RepID=A0A3P9H6V4_ORYLA